MDGVQWAQHAIKERENMKMFLSKVEIVVAEVFSFQVLIRLSEISQHCRLFLILVEEGLITVMILQRDGMAAVKNFRPFINRYLSKFHGGPLSIFLEHWD